MAKSLILRSYTKDAISGGLAHEHTSPTNREVAMLEDDRALAQSRLNGSHVTKYRARALLVGESSGRCLQLNLIRLLELGVYWG